MVRNNKLPSSNRQLKVGEILRRVLIEVISNDLYDPILEKISLTIPEVKVTPDLKQANVYVLPLFNSIISSNELIKHLKNLSPKIRYLVTNKVELRYSPELKFKFDTSFDEAAKIQDLLKD
jgi:ribosome-binding factor A